MIRFDNVSKEYRDNGNSITNALYDITLGVEQGEFVSIVGHSGAGKTTLLKMLLAEESPSTGAVFFEEVDIHGLSNKEIPQLRRRIGTVFQDFKLLPNKTAYENIAFAMEAAGRSDEEIAADVPQALELVDLGDKVWNFPHQLSGGERQRIAIARAIINQPDLLIADEPTGNLDPLNTQDIIDVLRKINELGTTILLTTHNKGVIDDLGKRVITMEGGRIIRDDKHGRYVL
ncbi:MAG: cell division ATP-binding protein FtsE [Candidatus Yonathbacteria bacterium]|nr:cell division ATP-binding protein FtsE [Candidatus Yonathbacteria bacterium]NTW47441.1 cell division ATP-binding protein FtsE [Candidatus Yonathbacteria bacterium]